MSDDSNVWFIQTKGDEVECRVIEAKEDFLKISIDGVEHEYKYNQLVCSKFFSCEARNATPVIFELRLLVHGDYPKTIFVSLDQKEVEEFRVQLEEWLKKVEQSLQEQFYRECIITCKRPTRCYFRSCVSGLEFWASPEQCRICAPVDTRVMLLKSLVSDLCLMQAQKFDQEINHYFIEDDGSVQIFLDTGECIRVDASRGFTPIRAHMNFPGKGIIAVVAFALDGKVEPLHVIKGWYMCDEVRASAAATWNAMLDRLNAERKARFEGASSSGSSSANPSKKRKK